MPRTKLSNVSIADLKAEIQRRTGKLDSLIKQRDALDKEIAQLQGIATSAPVPAPKAGKAKKAAKSKPGPKPKARRSKRKTFAITGEQFILDMAKGKGATTKEINKAWTQAGRGGSSYTTLSRLFKEKKLKKEKLPGKQGSRYTLE